MLEVAAVKATGRDSAGSQKKREKKLHESIEHFMKALNSTGFQLHYKIHADLIVPVFKSLKRLLLLQLAYY